MTKPNLRSKDSSTRKNTEKLCEKTFRDLESENEALKRVVEELRTKLGDVSISSSSVGTLSDKSSVTKEKDLMSRSNSNSHSKYNTESCVKRFDGQVQKLKAQKVKLQFKIKIDSMHFRLVKTSLEKEVLQLKKEIRKSEFEKQLMSALNKRQKLILQVKDTQALSALKRLKLQLQSKSLTKETSSMIQDCNDGSKLLLKFNRIHSGYERQMKEMGEDIKTFSLQGGVLKAEFELRDNQNNHIPVDLELKELKEEFNKLTTLVSKMEVTKFQGEATKSSISSKIANNQTQPIICGELAEYTVSNTDINYQPNLEQSKTEMCCSCTKKSLCKTKSCKCKANGSGCGNSCGCLASKCSNREDKVIQPLREIGNIREAGQVCKVKNVQKPVAKKPVAKKIAK